MPELPEVETVKESLKQIILSRKITDVEIFYDNIIKNVTPKEFKELIINETFRDVKRVGKYLIFICDNITILSHLRMEGKYNYLKDEKKDVHEHIIFHLDNSHTLRYNDTRKFGTMHVFKTTNIDDLMKIEPLNKLGIEPLSDKLTLEYLKSKFQKNKKPIKSVLLDQSIISGLGNIYADEVCYYSKINPVKQTSLLTDDDILKIIESSKVVINKAIKLGGTTIKSFTSSHMITGRFQNELKIHTKSVCECGCKVTKIFVGGRGTYYCSVCQK